MPNASNEKNAVLFYHALTSLHAGSGANPGVIDLPIQRERHTKWPAIPASALKGVLRDHCRNRLLQSNGHHKKHEDADRDDQIINAFGRPLGQEAEDKAGCLSFTDARILAFPVRSMFGVFAWVSCPAVLQRFARDLALAGFPPAPVGNLAVNANQILVVDRTCKLKDTAGTSIILEDHPFTPATLPPDLLASLSALPLCDAATLPLLGEQFAVISDDAFNQFAEHATEVQMRIALDYDTKTVRKGALFSQEFLPTETLLYSLALLTASRPSSGSAMAFLKESIGGEEGCVLQIGGDETTGKGFCRVHLHSN